MAKREFTSRRAPIYADVPDEQWNDWRWQLSHRLNTAEEIEKVLPLTESERRAVGLGSLPGRYHPLLHLPDRPEDPDDPIRRQVIPTSAEMVPFTAMMEDSLAEDRHSPGAGPGASLPRPRADAGHHAVRLLLPLLHALPHRRRPDGPVLARRVRDAARLPASGPRRCATCSSPAATR